MENNQTANEPSGIRLMRLMDTQLLQIIHKELKNETRICLYGTGTHWVAFEQSAYLLIHIFPMSDISIVEHQEYPFPVVIASISDDELRGYGKRHIFSRDYTDYKEFSCLIKPSVTYNIWHYNESQKFSEGIRTVSQSQSRRKELT